MVELFFSLLLVAVFTAALVAVFAVTLSWSSQKTMDERELARALARRDNEQHIRRVELERRKMLQLGSSKWFRPMTRPGSEE